MNYISNPSCPHPCITRDAVGSGGHPISASTANASWTSKPPRWPQEDARACQHSGKLSGDAVRYADADTNLLAVCWPH